VETPVASAEPTPTGDLAGTAWKLQTLDGTKVPSSVVITIEFDADGTVSGSGGCNNYSGTYTASGESVTIENVASTMMACEDPQASWEADYFEALAAASTWTRDGNTFTLTGPDGQPEMVFAKTFRFGATNWVLASIDGDDVPADVQPTLQFGEDGVVTGSGGCNDYSGPYTVKGRGIDIGPLVTTRKACAPEVMAVESNFLGGLEKVTTWRVGGGNLTLLGPKNKPTMVFNRPQ
jgi:heat shock protein HslJ